MESRVNIPICKYCYSLLISLSCKCMHLKCPCLECIVNPICTEECETRLDFIKRYGFII